MKMPAGDAKDGGATAACGASSAKKCELGKTCAVAEDCGLLFCKNGVCSAPTAEDGVQNGAETDVDCGGGGLSYDGVSVPAAPACGLGKQCLVDTDCESAICAENKTCVESPSCRPIHGGVTCGTGETGEAGAVHESCCKTLPVPGMEVNGKQVYLDKYEITAGRIREWVKAIAAENGGVPDVQGWVKSRMASDPLLAAMFPGDWADYLPSQSSGQMREVPSMNGGTVELDFGLDDQVGPTSYWRDVQVEGSTGCWMGAGGYGHRTYWFDAAQSAAYGETPRAAVTKEISDEKSANCLTPLMFAAFCAWDGGYMVRRDVLRAAWGPATWPWGDGPGPKDENAKLANYNASTDDFGASVVPRYLFPQVGYGTFADDMTPLIAAPGRFPGDVASKGSWMDLGGNLLEWSFSGGKYWGWTGSSFEGHHFGRDGDEALAYLEKYAKGTTRCMRLQ